MVVGGNRKNPFCGGEGMDIFRKVYTFSTEDGNVSHFHVLPQVLVEGLAADRLLTCTCQQVFYSTTKKPEILLLTTFTHTEETKVLILDYTDLFNYILIFFTSGCCPHSSRNCGSFLLLSLLFFLVKPNQHL